MSYKYKLVPINDLHIGDIVLAQYSVRVMDYEYFDFITTRCNGTDVFRQDGISIVLSKEHTVCHENDIILYNRITRDPNGDIYINGARFRIDDAIRKWYATSPYAIVFLQHHHIRSVRRLLKDSDRR